MSNRKIKFLGVLFLQLKEVGRTIESPECSRMPWSECEEEDFVISQVHYRIGGAMIPWIQFRQNPRKMNKKCPNLRRRRARTPRHSARFSVEKHNQDRNKRYSNAGGNRSIISCVTSARTRHFPQETRCRMPLVVPVSVSPLRVNERQ